MKINQGLVFLEGGYTCRDIARAPDNPAWTPVFKAVLTGLAGLVFSVFCSSLFIGEISSPGAPLGVGLGSFKDISQGSELYN